jgi:hypothetical protein
MPVTPEAAGSSPVDPAILRSPPASFGWQAKRACFNARRLSAVAAITAKADSSMNTLAPLEFFSDMPTAHCAGRCATFSFLPGPLPSK